MRASSRQSNVGLLARSGRGLAGLQTAGYSHKLTFKHPATSIGAISLDCYYSSWGRPVSEAGVERRLTTILATDVVG